MPKKASPVEESKRELEKLYNGTINHELLEECGGLFTQLVLRSLKHTIQSVMDQEVTDFTNKKWGSKDLDGTERKAMRNGYEKRRLKTSEGSIELSVPQTRGGAKPFRSDLLAGLKGSRSEQLETLVIESYARGLSTRDIEDTFKDQDGKPLVSKDTVSELTEVFNEQYESFRNKDLKDFDVAYLFADAVYESVRNESKGKEGIFVAWAILADGSKVLLSMALGVSESSEAWKEFFNDMIRRGLRQPLLVSTDGGPGLIAATDKIFYKSKRQRCIAHKLRNINSKLPRKIDQAVKNEFKAPFYAANRKVADLLVTQLTEKYSETYPEAIRCLLNDLDACLTHLEFPQGHHRFIRTTNLLERVFAEQKRRTKIIPSFKSEKSCLKLVFATLFRVSEKWKSVSMSEMELTALKNLRKLMWGETNFTLLSMPFAA